MSIAAHAPSPEEEYWQQHLPGFVELAVLGSILCRAMFSKWLDISSFRQQTWKESNLAEQQKHRKHLGSLLGEKPWRVPFNICRAICWRCMRNSSPPQSRPVSRSSSQTLRQTAGVDSRQLLADSSDGRTQLGESGDNDDNDEDRHRNVQTCRMGAGTELLLSMLSLVSSITYFAVLPPSLTKNTAPTAVGTFTLLGFYVFCILFILLNLFLDASMGMMLVERMLNLRCFGKCRRVLAETLLPILQGRSRSGKLVRYAVLKPLDICWVWMVKTVMFPLVCTYQTKPPHVTMYPELTCWDNGHHWALVLLSVWSVSGMVSWQLSQLLRQSGWPENMYWFRFEGVYSRGEETLTMSHEKLEAGEHQLRAVRRFKKDGTSLWMKSEYVLKIIPPFEQHTVAVEAREEGRADFDGFSKFSCCWPCIRRAEEIAEVNQSSSMLYLDLHEDHSGATEYIQFSPSLEDFHRHPLLSRHQVGDTGQELLTRRCSIRDGRWKRAAFLKVPYFQDPGIAFWLAVLKIVGSVLWASFGHRAEHYRAFLSFTMACLAFAESWIVSHYKPWAFHLLNYGAVVGMFLAGSISLVSFGLCFHTDAEAVMQHWSKLTILLACSTGVVTLSITSLIISSCFGRGSKRNMLWAVNSEETAERLTLTLEQWKEGHRLLRERLGEGLAPCQIENHKTGKSCRILQIEVPPGVMIPLEECIERGKLQGIDDVIAYVVGATQLEDQLAAKDTEYFVTVSNEWHPWPSLSTLAAIGSQPPPRVAQRHDLIKGGFGNFPETVPRALVVGVCGHGKSTLLSVLCRFSHANQGFKVLKGFTKEGVTQKTEAIEVFIHDENTRKKFPRLFIDMPGMKDGDLDETFLADAKNTLSSSSESSGSRATGGACLSSASSGSRATGNFINQILLVVNVHMMRRASQIEGVLKTLYHNFGEDVVALLTVVFTHKDSTVEQLEQQREIVENFKSTFCGVFGEAVADVEFQLPSSLSTRPAMTDDPSSQQQSERSVPCFFIDCLAALPDQAWQHSADARLDARRTLGQIERQIDLSADKVRFPTGHWPKVISGYSGEELIHTENSNILTMIPSFSYEGKDEWRQEFTLVTEEEGGGLELKIEPGSQGHIIGKCGRAGDYTIHVNVTSSQGGEAQESTRATNEGEEVLPRVLPSCVKYTFQMKVGLNDENLKKYINEALDKRRISDKEKESDRWEDGWSDVLKWRNEREVADLKLAKDFMQIRGTSSTGNRWRCASFDVVHENEAVEDQLINETVHHVQEMRKKKNEDVSKMWKLYSESQEKKKDAEKQLSETAQKLDIVKGCLEAQSRRQLLAGALIKITEVGDLDEEIKINYSESWMEDLRQEMENHGRCFEEITFKAFQDGSETDIRIEEFTIEDKDGNPIDSSSSPLVDESKFPLRYIPKEPIRGKNAICQKWDASSGTWILLLMDAKNPPAYVRVHDRDLALRPSQCQNSCLSNDAGAYGNCKPPYTRCRECLISLCTYHGPINMSDAIGSFGGHVCPAKQRPPRRRSLFG
eukprot:TRINITY_DN1050_c0_g2_i2.p1 TRINITY_DN1050_c0_g2~~TRINITY_DN1050_c0_g2_i2.p1  ORF type:complete len:1520 (-),score=215.65 TRINITY_DN1050_c0_g2_i2:37-4596(-)